MDRSKDIESQLREAILERLVELGLTAVVAPHAHGEYEVVSPTSSLRSRLTITTSVGRARSREAAAMLLPQDEKGRGEVLGLPHVTPSEGARMIARGLGYVDSGGNAHLDLPGTLLHVEGRKPTVKPLPGMDRRSDAFTPSGLRVVFVLAVRPDLAARPYSEIAAAARVSVGTGHRAVTDLLAEEIVVEVGRRRMVRDRSTLARRWLGHFGTTLLPRLGEEAMPGPGVDWWHRLGSRRCTLGGEAALVQTADLARSPEIVIYADSPRSTTLRAVRRSGLGDHHVVLRDRFWDPALVTPGAAGAPGLLILADLEATRDARAREAAASLRSRPDIAELLDG